MNSRLRPVVSFIAASALAVTVLGWPGGPAFAVAAFSDDFELGNMLRWTSTSGLAAQSAVVPPNGGSFAARSTTSVAWASKTLLDPTTDAEVSLRFHFGSRQSPVWLTRLRTPSNGNLMKVMVNNGGKLVYRNDVTGVTRTSAQRVINGNWYRLQVHVTVAGANGHVQVSLDGTPVPGLDRLESLGTAPIGRVEIGNRPTGKTYDLALDDVVVTDLAAAPAPQPPGNVAVAITPPGEVEVSWSPPAAGPAPSSYRVYRDNALVGTVDAPTTTFTDLAADGVTKYLYSVTTVTPAEESDPSPFAVAEMQGFTAGSDAVVYAAGDIVCKPSAPVTSSTCRHGDTADIVSSGAAAAVLALGDLQYEIGRPSDYQAAYDPTWGSAKSFTKPAIGNHEYRCDIPSEGCSFAGQGYFDYFGSAAGGPSGWYADQIAGWTVLSINSNCKPDTTFYFTQCQVGSAQYQWVQSQLASDGQCTVAMFHHPRFSSGLEHGGSAWMQDMWALLADSDVDLVLSGHEHLYERFAPANAAGERDPGGTPSFIVGTGGKNHATAGPPSTLSDAVIDDSFGVLKLTSHDDGYDWAFVPAWGDLGADSGPTKVMCQ